MPDTRAVSSPAEGAPGAAPPPQTVAPKTPVEDVLLAHPGVAECAVVGVPSAEWGEEVQAFIVGRDPKIDAAAMEAHVRSSELSPYQRPRAYHFVHDLPRTSTNKVLRRTLRETAIGLCSAKSETTVTQSTGKI